MTTTKGHHGYTKAAAALHEKQTRVPSITETIREQTEFIADMREARAQLRRNREAMSARFRPLIEQRGNAK